MIFMSFSWVWTLLRTSHIINGHILVLKPKGEHPVHANGKMLDRH